MVRNTYIEGLNLPPNHPFRRDAERLTQSFNTDTYKQDGIIRWKSNNQVPPQEILDFWKHIGKRFNMQKSIQARNKDNQMFMEQYRKSQANRKRTLEELSEMRNAFGEGTVVVDVITGKRTRL